MKILVVDDEESMRHMLSVMLKKHGYDAVTAESAECALEVLKKEEFDFILCDIRMPGMGGLGFLKALGGVPGVPGGAEKTVIMMSAFGTMDTAIECMKAGAYDFISKPFKADEIVLTIMKAEERERLKMENRQLRREARNRMNEFITNDPAMLDLLAMVRKVADYNTTVLITGESGTGKELVARALHYNGNRSSKPFVALNCGAIPPNLLESELFGHVKGAFTDAVSNKNGLFQEASGGTIFLDEIGDIPFELQVKLLRVLEEREIRRVGDTRSRKIDVRVVAATAKDLSKEIISGGFREDLYYRLNVIGVNVPPLRERIGDVELLSGHFSKIFARRYSRDLKGITEKALEALKAYRWPGNVRELENIMERAVLLEEGEYVDTGTLPFSSGQGGGGSAVPGGLSSEQMSIKKRSMELEKELITEALKQSGGNKTHAAKILEISHRALLYKIKNYAL